MNLIDLYDSHKKCILDGHYILIEFDLFFKDENIEKCTRFVIDDASEIKQLKSIIEQTRMKDQNAIVYVCVYGKDLLDNHGERFLYGDSIWIYGSTSIDFVNNEFHNHLDLEPTRIESLDNSGEKDQSTILYFSNYGNVVDTTMPCNRQKLESIIILYWNKRV